MKLEYKIEPILFHLRHVQKMCKERVMCAGCPFRVANRVAGYCVFKGPYGVMGAAPEEWELDDVCANIIYVDTDSIKIKKEDGKDG